MNFKDPSKVADVVQRMLDSDDPRAINRTRIHSHFNGNPPWTDDEAEELRVQYNVPWGEGPTIMDNARGQWETAFTSKDKYFGVTLKIGPPYKRVEWSQRITQKLAEIMKANSEYTECVNSVGAGVMLDGIGPVNWENKYKWAPDCVAIEDLKVNSRALTSFSNLGYFAIMRRYAPFNLYNSALGEYKDPNWNKAMVKRILGALSDVNSEQTDWTQYQFPERLEEDFKSNGGYWGSDAVPTVNCWDFYHRGEDRDSKKWFRKIMLDWDQPTLGGAAQNQKDSAMSSFLYESKEPYANDLSQIIHVTFANGAHVGPFRYHSVRGLGYRLFRPSITLDKMRNKAVEAWFVELLHLFKNVPAEDRERLEMIYLQNFGVMPQGAEYLPNQDRYKPDLTTVLSGINQMRQLMAESSATYVQDTDSGEESARETATKTTARMQQANRLVSTFLGKAYGQMEHQYREICRRFCIKDSEDEDVKAFHEWANEEGIPEECIDVKQWDVKPERTMGSGDRMLASAMMDKLMTQYVRYNPQAQQLLLRIFSEVNGDVDLATDLVPLEQEQEASPTVIQAYDDISTLMLGLPAPMKRSANMIEYVETLLQALSALVQRVEQKGGMTDEQTILGLFTVAQEIQKRIDVIAEDKEELPRVKVYGDALKRLMNQIKAFAQRLAQQQQKRGQQMDPKIMAQIQGKMLMDQTNAKIKEKNAAQKMKHKELSFILDQRRKDKESDFDLARQAREAQVDVMSKDLQTEAEIRNGARKMAAFDNDSE